MHFHRDCRLSRSCCAGRAVQRNQDVRGSAAMAKSAVGGPGKGRAVGCGPRVIVWVFRRASGVPGAAAHDSGSHLHASHGHWSSGVSTDLLISTAVAIRVAEPTAISRVELTATNRVNLGSRNHACQNLHGFAKLWNPAATLRQTYRVLEKPPGHPCTCCKSSQGLACR